MTHDPLEPELSSQPVADDLTDDATDDAAPETDQLDDLPPDTEALDDTDDDSDVEPPEHALPPDTGHGLLCVQSDRAPFFRAVGGPLRIEGDEVALTPSVRAALGLGGGEEVGVLPF